MLAEVSPSPPVGVTTSTAASPSQVKEVAFQVSVPVQAQFGAVLPVPKHKVQDLEQLDEQVAQPSEQA